MSTLSGNASVHEHGKIATICRAKSPVVSQIAKFLVNQVVSKFADRVLKYTRIIHCR